jgi:GPH family glycoside/pentoside/hexuronide:cation symporter
MHKLSFKEKLGFSLGELGGSGFWQIFVIFLPIFYTDVFGIPAVTAGGIFLFVRLLDA